MIMAWWIPVLLAAGTICTAQHQIPRLQRVDYFQDSHGKHIRQNETLANMKIFEVLDIGRFLYKVENVTRFLSVTDNCQSDVEVLIASLKSNDTTERTVSMKYVDAQAKIPHGILQGNLMWIGDYQECISMDKLVNHLTGKTFGSKYFSLRVTIEQSVIPYVNLGLCLPDSCSPDDAMNLTNAAIKYLKILQPSIHLEAKASFAYTRDKTEIKGGVLATVIVSSFLILFVVLGTTAGILQRNNHKQSHLIQETNIEQTYLIDSQPAEATSLLSDNMFRPLHKKREWPTKTVLKLLQSFSFIENSKKLFGTETARGPLACLNGIRVLSMLWVILGHSYEFATVVMDNPLPASKIVQRFSFQFVVNGTLSVDSFFFLSGLLVAYLALKEVRDKGRMNWVYFVCHRYWRLTPLYAYVLLFFTNISKTLIFGPFSATIANFKQIDSCKPYWWTNLLYINNFYPYYGSLNDGCMPWTWYLANDMQFYLFLSPIVILLLWKIKRLGMVVTCFLIVGGVFSRGFLVLYYGMHEPNNLITKHKDDPWADGGGYVRPYTRWSVYLVGMLTGYFLFTTGTRIRLSKSAATIGWCICTATGIAVVWGLYYYNSHPGTEMNLTASVFYYSLNRTVWGVCLAWIVIACVAEKGGPVRQILSWTIWAPLGRLTYAAYLVHPIIIMVYYDNFLSTLHFTDLTMVYAYIGNVVMTYGIAFIVSMAVEAPMIQLEKAILGMLKKRK